MTYKITPILFFLASLTACVSPKVVDELKAQRQETFKQNQEVKKENNSLLSENTELKAKLSQLNVDVDRSNTFTE